MGDTWSEPRVIQSSRAVHLCEPGFIASPDGKEWALLLRENRRQRPSQVVFSKDEGRTWSSPRPLHPSLSGDRHTLRYLPDGRLVAYQLRETEGFANWLLKLHDARAKARILARLESARLGNLGDVRSVGGGASEMRVDVGAGYQVYFTRRQRVVIVLLCGGDKSSQSTDIARAHRMAASIE